MLARAQQDAVWDRTQLHNKLRSLLREYYPAMLEASADKRGGLARPEARAVLAAAATPAAAVGLTATQLRAALQRAGRQRGLDAEADRLQAIFRAEHLHQAAQVEDAMPVALQRSQNPQLLRTRTFIERFPGRLERLPLRASTGITGRVLLPVFPSRLPSARTRDALRFSLIPRASSREGRLQDDPWVVGCGARWRQ